MRGLLLDKWKHFERLVKAIHQAADQGADVRWSETWLIWNERGSLPNITARDYRKLTAVSRPSGGRVKRRMPFHYCPLQLALGSGTITQR